MPLHPKVLIVDDNEVMRTLLRGILRNEVYQIIGEARNGTLALQFIERSKPDIVIMDVMMPEMDGLEALQNIKEKNPEIVVVMITGNPSVDIVQESIHGGASGFIIKPFNSAKVLDTLDRAWQTRKIPVPPMDSTAPKLEQRDD
ncbi:response regulator [Propionivibrio sp.]|uniref:response regulator n=1 Tax=Propionivibrio sp. TaxID=2212460 RepID=UPI003BF3B076